MTAVWGGGAGALGAGRDWAGAAQQTTFYFHSNFWVNLHHFLYEQAI